MSGAPKIELSSSLDAEQRTAVERIACTAAAADGVAPLSERTLLSLRSPDPLAGDGRRIEHLLARSGDDLLGYAQTTLITGGPSRAEVVVAPERRRKGVGSALLEAVLDDGAGVWAHGNLPPARALAAAEDLVVTRDLWQMARPMNGANPLAEPVLPQGFSVRTFQVGRDEADWLAVNARAFADHPEQGATTLDDLLARTAKEWFDPGGFFLVHDDRGERPRLAAFHWTKVEGAKGGRPSGEVYVVGVDPAYQGGGLGRAVTLIGLRHLQELGVSTVRLYVESDNAPAIATYHRLGFVHSGSDVVYSRRVHKSVPR